MSVDELFIKVGSEINVLNLVHDKRENRFAQHEEESTESGLPKVLMGKWDNSQCLQSFSRDCFLICRNHNRNSHTPNSNAMGLFGLWVLAGKGK